MKRFYFPTAIAALLTVATMMGLGSYAAIGNSEPSPQSKSKNIAQVRSKLTPQARLRMRLGIPSSGSMLMPAVSGTQNIISEAGLSGVKRTLEKPRANLYGIVGRHSTMTRVDEAQLVSISTASRLVSTIYTGEEFFQAHGDDYTFMGSAYNNIDGVIYVPMLGFADYQSSAWKVVDLATGTQTGYCPVSGTFSIPYAATYNEADGMIYGLALDDDTHSNLVRYNPKDGFKADFIDHIADSRQAFFLAIAYNPVDKQIYVFDENNRVYTVDTEEGAITNVGELVADINLFPKIANGLVAYSPMDHAFVTIYRDNNNGYNNLFMIDAETWDVYNAGRLQGRNDIFLSSIFCVDGLAEDNAPELPAPPVFSFTKAELTGKATITAPSVTYYGVEIPASSNITMTLAGDGKNIATETLKPGASKELNVTFEEGLHNIELTATLNGLASPVNKSTLYVGNDKPLAPRNLSIEADMLSWQVPGNKGVHNGYVDVNALTYDVYVSGEKQNSSPLTETSFRLNRAGAQRPQDITVTATANSQTSDPARINVVYGSALSLPFSAMPTSEESELFTAVNANNDAAGWSYGSNKELGTEGMVFPMSLFNDADDWLMFPLINFPDKDAVYEVSFSLSAVGHYDSRESFDIFLGHGIAPEYMDNRIYSIDEFNVVQTPQTVRAIFSVPEAGDYNLGLHCRSLKEFEAKGMFINNISVRKLENQSSAIPAVPTKVEAYAAPKGELAIEMDVTLPTLDIVGNALPAGKELTATAALGSNTGSAKGLPGTTVHVKVNADELGYHTATLVISNENGEGMATTYRRYVGIDRPLPPTNIAYDVAQDNRSVKISWDHPGEVGENGGYVDPDKLTYEIYMRTTALQYAKIGETNELSIVFQPEAEKLAEYIIGPAVRSEGGLSRNSIFQNHTLGVPYEMPMLEEFNTASFTYGNLYTFDTHDEYSGSRWENYRSLSGLGIGDPMAVEGAIAAFSEKGGPCYARIRLPKGTTKDVSHPTFFNLRWWDYLEAPAIEIWGRRAGNQTVEQIATIKPNNPLKGVWRDEHIQLPDSYLNQGWVEFYIRTHLTGMTTTEYLIVDSWGLANDVEYDLKVLDIDGPRQVIVGNKAKYEVMIANSGTLRNSGTVTVELLNSANAPVDTQVATIPTQLNASQTFSKEFEFEITGDYATAQNSADMSVRVTVKSDKDEVPSNDQRLLTVTAVKPQVPVVHSLQRDYEVESNIALKWRAPQLTYGSLQDFELETPFQNVNAFGSWQNIDNDHHLPIEIGQTDADGNSAGISLTWDGYMAPSAWTVIDFNQTQVTGDPRLYAHSGKNLIIGRAPYTEDGAGEFNQASDWLISPEIKGGSTVSFWFNTMESSVKEYIGIWYSTTDTKLDPENATNRKNGSFTRLRSFDKIGSEAWEKVEYKLPDDAKYFALVYESFNALGALLDDISITPANLETWNLTGYNVYRQPEGGKAEKLAEKISDRTFTDTAHDAAGPAIYWVTASVTNNEGKEYEGSKSNLILVGITGVDDMAVLKGISGGKNEISIQGYEGKEIMVFDMKGQLVDIFTAESDSIHRPCQSGIYVVTAGGRFAKILVK